MSFSFNARGKNQTSGAPQEINPVNTMLIATETVALGAAKANRFSSVIDFIPTDKDGRQLPFTIISNTGTTNTSGSVSDQLYASYDRAGAYFMVTNTLRDCNYSDDLHQGTSYRSIDTNKRVRHVDPQYVGQYPYYKVRFLQAAVESSAKTIGLAVIVGAPKEKQLNWKAVF